MSKLRYLMLLVVLGLAAVAVSGCGMLGGKPTPTPTPTKTPRPTFTPVGGVAAVSPTLVAAKPTTAAPASTAAPATTAPQATNTPAPPPPPTNTPQPAAPPPPTNTPRPTNTPAPPTATPTPAPPTATPLPPATPTPAFKFRYLGTGKPQPNCGSTVIKGVVQDKYGNPAGGVTVRGWWTGGGEGTKIISYTNGVGEYEHAFAPHFNPGTYVVQIVGLDGDNMTPQSQAVSFAITGDCNTQVGWVIDVSFKEN